MTSFAPITLTDDERAALTVWSRLEGAARRALRAKIVLLAAEGHTNRQIAWQLGASMKTVALWRRRFLESRLPGVEKESPRRDATKEQARENIARRILEKTRTKPPGGAPRWTTRSLAKALGVSPSMVQRVWTAHLTPRDENAAGDAGS